MKTFGFQIDHVELLVPDRFQAAAWYQRVLGLEILKKYQDWAEVPGGPLMVGSSESGTKLALFDGKPSGSKPGVGFHLTAFGVDGPGFIDFLSSLKQLNLKDSFGHKVTPSQVRDRGAAFSLYFCDPWSNQFEITTYEHDFVRDYLFKHFEDL